MILPYLSYGHLILFYQNYQFTPIDIMTHPLLSAVAAHIPLDYHATTPLYYAATAGMRLVSIQHHERVYRDLYHCLAEAVQSQTNNYSNDKASSHSSSMSSQTDLPPPMFDVRPHYITTLPGTLEGYFGAVAVNYLSGTIHVNLTVAQNPSTMDAESS